MPENTTSDFGLIRRLLLEAQPFWPHIIAILLIDLLATPLALLAPLPLKIAVDSVLGSKPLPDFLSNVIPESWVSAHSLLLFVAILLVVTALLSQVQGLFSGLLRAFTGGKLVMAFRNQLFRHAQRLSFAYHDMKGISDTMYRVQYDTAAIQLVIIDGLIPMVAAVVTLVSMIYVTAQINMQLAMVALIVAPFIVGINKFYRRPLRTKKNGPRRDVCGR